MWKHFQPARVAQGRGYRHAQGSDLPRDRTARSKGKGWVSRLERSESISDERAHLEIHICDAAAGAPTVLSIRLGAVRRALGPVDPAKHALGDHTHGNVPCDWEV